ncbi:hypothetical protein [Tardiphaga sp.]|jgi:hypothetical protein|uniref:bestrophin-like domain n=1 Tax=Tardiphaga sp. TaxID=1926292 RepID=UPI0037DA720D
MTRAWLDLNTFGIFATLCVLYYGAALFLVFLCFGSPLRKQIQKLNGIVAPFFSSVAILFGLLTGFLANDVGERGRHAVRAMQAEASEIRNVYALSIAAVSDMTDIRKALKVYVNSVLTDEWPAMIRDEPSPRTEVAYDDVLREVSDLSVGRESGTPVQVALLSAVIRAGTARSERLSIAADQTNDLKWVSVLILGLLTQVGLALVHMDRPRAMLTALTVFGSAAIVALGLIALQEHPYEGAFRVSKAPLQHLLTLPELGPGAALPQPPKPTD